MNSILQERKECYVCGRVDCLEEHHIYPGNPNRKISERHGFKVWLCHWDHNEPPDGAHFNRALDLRLKRDCQAKYEESHTREAFRALIGKSYL